MKTLLIALLFSMMLLEQNNPDEEPETPISYVAVFLVVASLTFLIKKFKASDTSNSGGPGKPD